jgi:hypothetical protein
MLNKPFTLLHLILDGVVVARLVAKRAILGQLEKSKAHLFSLTIAKLPKNNDSSFTIQIS